MVKMIPSCMVFLLATSCFVFYQEAVNSLKWSPICCELMAEFEYDTIPKDASMTFNIDEFSAAFIFPSGKSYFKAFTLPKRKSPYYINVKSFALGEDIRKAQIFYPQLALLDENHIVVKQSVPADFTLKKAGVMEMVSISWTALRIKFEGSLLVDSPQAKYVVVFTTEKLINSFSPFSTISTTQIIFPGIVTLLPVGTETVRIAHSPFGLLHIEIEDELLPVS